MSTQCVMKDPSYLHGDSQNSDKSSLYTQWVIKDPSFLHDHSKDFDQTELMPRLIGVFL